MSGTIKLGKYLSIDKESLISIEPDEMYTIAGVQNYGKGVLNKRVVKGSEMTMKKYQVIKRNQLMWCKVDTKNGAFGITKEEHEGSLASTNMCLANIDTGYLNPDFLQLLFTNEWFYNSITAKSTGTTNRQYLTPPQLFELVEIPDFDVDEQEEFLKRYRSLKESGLFEELDQQQTYLQLLRQTILHEAVQGKLTKQDPTDEPATDLLKRIKAEKEKLIKAGKLKKEKELLPISEYEIPFELPKGWVWCRLAEVALKVTDGTHHSPPNIAMGDHMYVTAKNIKDEGVVLENISYVTKKVHDEIYSRCNPEYGDILYIKDGATTGTVTINNLKEPFSMLSSVALIKVPKDISNDYLLYVLRSPYYYKAARNDMAGIAITRVTLTKMVLTLIPLPPLSEQQRIVAKVQQLHQQLIQLETHVQKSRQYAQQLLQSMLKETFTSKKEQVNELV